MGAREFGFLRFLFVSPEGVALLCIVATDQYHFLCIVNTLEIN